MVTGSLRHEANGSLLLAGGSSQETLVLVRVSIRSAHGNVFLMAVKLADTLDICSILPAGSPKATRHGVAHAQVALLFRQIWAVGLPGAAVRAPAAGEGAPGGGEKQQEQQAGEPTQWSHHGGGREGGMKRDWKVRWMVG